MSEIGVLVVPILAVFIWLIIYLVFATIMNIFRDFTDELDNEL